MKNAITLVCAAWMAVAGSMVHAAAPEFDLAEKALLRGMVSEVQGKLKSAVRIGDKAITLLPVRGDKDAYMEHQLLGAFVGAGLTAVVSNDAEKDARFKRILAEIKWDSAQKRLASVDPATIDELGRLMSTQVLMEARLSVVRTETKPGKKASLSAELNLLGYAVATKKYVWSATVVAASEPGVPPKPVVLLGVSSELVPLAAEVGFKPADDASRTVCDRLDTLARGTLAELGYKVDSDRASDLKVTVDVAKSVFDKSGSYLVYEGSAKAKASVSGADARLLGETAIDARGLRGLGEASATRNLADALFEQFAPWMKRTLKVDAIGFEAMGFEVTLPAPMGPQEGLSPIAEFKKAAMAMDGVRSCVLVSQDGATGRVAFRVVYEKAKFPIGFLNALFIGNPGLGKLLAE